MSPLLIDDIEIERMLVEVAKRSGTGSVTALRLALREKLDRQVGEPETAAAEVPVEAPKAAPLEAPEIAPVEPPETAPVEVPVEAPETAPVEVPMEAPEKPALEEGVPDEASQEEALPEEPEGTPFERLGLGEEVLAVVAEVGFVEPTPVQKDVIPVALAARDVIGLAETGSGKTAAFVLPLAERLPGKKEVRALVLSPTRELALQTFRFAEQVGARLGFRSACLIGGVPIDPQIRTLRGHPELVVATPGRLLDHVQRRNIRLGRVRSMVLDEADHMLDLGFLPDVWKILQLLPEHRQMMLFSATMPPAVERLAARFMKDPVRVDLRPTGRVAQGIEHRLYLVRPEDKKPCLLSLLNEDMGSTLVFIRRKIDAEWLCKVLEKQGHPVARIHSDRSQRERVEALEGFREGKHRILVATDVASRGIDVAGIENIVNFNVPETVDDYVHRAGRTARLDAGGVVSTIAIWQEKPIISEIEKALGAPIPRCTAPGVERWEELTSPRRGKKIRRRRLL